jgi:hypothetical protein
MTERACAICGQNFMVLGGTKTCSTVCSNELQRQREHPYRQRSAERRRDRYLSDPVYREKLKAQRLAKRRARAEQRRAARSKQLPAPKTIATASRCRQQNLNLSERKGLAAELLRADPKQSDALIAWATLLSAPTVREIRLALERRGELELVATRIDKLGRAYPASRLPNRGRLAGAETLAARAIGRAFLKVGALRTLEIVLSQIPGAVDLATTPYCSVSTAHLAVAVGSRHAIPTTQAEAQPHAQD